MRTAIHGSLRYTTTKDGGSADIARSKYLSVLPVHKKAALLCCFFMPDFQPKVVTL